MTAKTRKKLKELKLRVLWLENALDEKCKLIEKERTDHRFGSQSLMDEHDQMVHAKRRALNDAYSSYEAKERHRRALGFMARSVWELTYRHYDGKPGQQPINPQPVNMTNERKP